MPRRKKGALLPLEVDILSAGLADGPDEFHGFELAQRIAGEQAGRKLTAHGTLYKALGRLEEAGLLTSRWEEETVATAEGRPRRRLYEVTGAGERRLAAWRREHGPAARPGRPGWQGST